MDVKEDIRITYRHHPNGRKASQYTYVNGEMTGVQTEWHANGVRSKEYVCVNRRKNGTQREWNSNGSIRLEYNFVNSRYHGTNTVWMKRRNGWTETHYDMDRTCWIRTWLDHRLVYQKIFENGYPKYEIIVSGDEKIYRSLDGDVGCNDEKRWTNGVLWRHVQYEYNYLTKRIVCFAAEGHGIVTIKLGDVTEKQYNWDGNPFCIERRRAGVILALTNSLPREINGQMERVPHGLHIGPTGVRMENGVWEADPNTAGPTYFMLGFEIQIDAYSSLLDRLSKCVQSTTGLLIELSRLVSAYADIPIV